MQESIIGEFIWEFEDRTVRYEAVLGGVFSFESAERQKQSIENANRRLVQTFAELEQLGISPVNGNERFQENLVYRYP